jgi:hypothetical protein
LHFFSYIPGSLERHNISNLPDNDYRAAMPPHPDEPVERTSGAEAEAETEHHNARSLNSKKRWWNVFKRWKEGQESDWWFASTGIP